MKFLNRKYEAFDKNSFLINFMCNFEGHDLMSNTAVVPTGLFWRPSKFSKKIFATHEI
jgi:hypothetical protein